MTRRQQANNIMLTVLKEDRSINGFKTILLKSLNTALKEVINDEQEREKTAKAFTKALYDGRMEINELENYVYKGNFFYRDIFVNNITNLYLD